MKFTVHKPLEIINFTDKLELIKQVEQTIVEGIEK